MRIRKSNLNLPKLWEQYSTIALILILTIIIVWRSSKMLSLEGFDKIMLNNAALLAVVLGVAFVMIGGGIDLSIGYQISLISVVISGLSVARMSPFVVLLGGFLTGLLCGLFNGVLVAYLGIVPFAATIASQIIFHGLSYVISGGSMVSYMPDIIPKLTKSVWLGLRLDAWISIALLIVFVVILRFSYAGKYLRAVGLKEQSAAQMGVPTKRIKWLSYCIASLFYTVASLLLISKQGYAGSEIGVGMEIKGIAAAYIGGALIQAEHPNVINLALGTLIVGLIESGLPQVGVNSYIHYIIIGIILIMTMWIHRTQRKPEY